eukprot:TRINITY_DN40261_c0_g1_i1.p1 TRINITY_DN40261_c0_g1~~TRINITY_DN40261_c0_g1_i1.p1  ORF type:complete len:253 (-),score=62.80 TRINITY_DN40261_c0_g1_i1:31-690(-)
MGCQGTYDNKDVMNFADTVVLGVKPNILPKVASSIQTSDSDSQLLVSLAAGIGIKQILHMFGNSHRVARVMPNTAVQVQAGATVYCTSSTATQSDFQLVDKLFSSVGKCWRVGEEHIDAVTGISGSGPAYMYLILEAITEEGVRQGLSPELAGSLAAQTMLGASTMAQHRHPALLRAEVTSPGGSTAEGIRNLEKGGLRYILMEGVAAAANRCKQIGSG